MGAIYFVSIYVAPNGESKNHHWHELMENFPACSHLILSGDFNAHQPSHAPYRFNRIGRIIVEIQEMYKLNFINENTPTHAPEKGGEGSVLNLFLASVSISDMVNSTTLPDLDSDHHPVMLKIPLKVDDVWRSSNRL